MPWPEIVKDFAKHFHWTVSDLLDGMTVAEFWIIACASGEQKIRHDPGAIRAKIDRERAKKGLPPSTGWPGDK
jgi:hypothetical protein